MAKEQAPGGANWTAAVRDTAGQALLSGGSPILAKYSACNGGRSVSGKPYLKAVDDPDDARCPLYRWGLSVSYDDLGRALAVPGTVKAVRATPGDVTVDWTGADGAGGHLTVPRTEFRAKVGAAVPPPPDRSKTVPSILFTLRPDDAGRVATLDGRGYGHGIGMSQWGAYGKALRGLKAGSILAAYYGGIQPAKVPAAKLPPRVGWRSTREAGPGPGGDCRAPAPDTGPASGCFRILDSKARVVVAVASGPWKVVPAAKGGCPRLLPPPGPGRPPGPVGAGHRTRRRRPRPAARGPVPIEPARLRLGHRPAPWRPQSPVLAPQVAGGTEEHRVTLPGATQPGIYPLTLTADSGPGRTATLTVAPVVVNLGPGSPPVAGPLAPACRRDPVRAAAPGVPAPPALGCTRRSRSPATGSGLPDRASRSSAARLAPPAGTSPPAARPPRRPRYGLGRPPGRPAPARPLAPPGPRPRPAPSAMVAVPAAT